MLSEIDDNNKFKAKIFKALSDPVRLDILDLFHDEKKCVCEIIPHVKLIQPIVTRHLKILTNCGLVKYQKEGNERLYSLTDPKNFNIIDGVNIELVNYS